MRRKRPVSPDAAAGDAPVLAVRDLRVEIETPRGRLPVISGLTFDVVRGETLALVGESGSGKTVTVMAMLGLLPANIAHVDGEVIFEGRIDLLTASRRQLRRIRGKEIGMVFQDPMTSLNPVLSVAAQLEEAIRVHHHDASRRVAHERSVALLDAVGVPGAARRIDEFPHQYSGGMRQRVAIAMAMANRPKVLIADEPTTALDVTVQAQVLEVLQEARTTTGAAMILITHDLGVVAEMADRVITMYAGAAVETGAVSTILQQPRHPYTLGLMRSLPRLDSDQERLDPIPGQPPSLEELPAGCPFQPRCEHSGGRAVCRDERPALLEVAAGHVSACHFATELARHGQPAAASGAGHT